jgi:hypothetical protein
MPSETNRQLTPNPPNLAARVSNGKGTSKIGK